MHFSIINSKLIFFFIVNSILADLGLNNLVNYYEWTMMIIIKIHDTEVEVRVMQGRLIPEWFCFLSLFISNFCCNSSRHSFLFCMPDWFFSTHNWGKILNDVWQHVFIGDLSNTRSATIAQSTVCFALNWGRGKLHVRL